MILGLDHPILEPVRACSIIFSVYCIVESSSASSLLKLPLEFRVRATSSRCRRTIFHACRSPPSIHQFFRCHHSATITNTAATPYQQAATPSLCVIIPIRVRVLGVRFPCFPPPPSLRIRLESISVSFCSRSPSIHLKKREKKIKTNFARFSEHFRKKKFEPTLVFQYGDSFETVAIIVIFLRLFRIFSASHASQSIPSHSRAYCCGYLTHVPATFQ